MNDIIYGKNDFKRIVSIEIIDDGAEIFYRDENGDLNSVIRPNTFWILSNEDQGGWSRLKGNLHYKWGRKYDTLGKFAGAKSYLKKRGADIFSIGDEKESFMVKYGYTYFKELHPKDLSVLSFDIETTGLVKDDTAKVLIISNTFRHRDNVIKKMFCHDEFETQGELIDAWCEWVQQVDPDTMITHNGYSFDLPYLAYVAERDGKELNLGRNGAPARFFGYTSEKRIDGSRSQSYNRVRVYGREVIDTMFLAINYDAASKKYESYALKKIIAQEGLEKQDRVFYDAGQIRFKYHIPEEWEKIKAYCADDSDDSLALFDIMSPSYFYMTQSIPKSFQSMVETASGSQLNSMMLRAYIQEGHSVPKASDVYSYEGAISFGAPGIYRNSFKVDVASLYPSIMIQYEVYDKAKDPKGYMLQMVKTFTAERLKNKKLAKETGDVYYDALQNAQKIVINSFYGFLGAAGLNFNSPANAALVTEHGREILQKSVEWACGFRLVKVQSKKDKDKMEWSIGEKISEGNGFGLVNCDTDSITIYKPDSEMGEDERKDVLRQINALYPERIRFEDDGYFNTIIVLKAKNYILWDGKKIKTKGSSLKDAKVEKALKEFMAEMINSIIKGRNDFADIYHKYVIEAMNVNDMSRWSSKKTISAKVLSSERTNESKIRDAIEGSEIVEGDKVYMYFKSDGSLGLATEFDGDYDKMKLLEKLYKKTEIFEEIIPPETFLNYKLKRNASALNEVINGFENGSSVF